MQKVFHNTKKTRWLPEDMCVSFSYVQIFCSDYNPNAIDRISIHINSWKFI